MPHPTSQLHLTVYASLMAALTAVGAFIAIPIGPVPIVLQNFFIILTGLLLGSRWGLASVGIYLLAGVCGLPIFAGGTGGIGRLIGPTGGYLLGYLPAVFLMGMISEKEENRIVRDVAAAVCGTLVVYACGVTWLRILTGMTWAKAFAVGMFPFLLGDALKIAAAVPVAKTLRPIVNKKQVKIESDH
jgi:biotin transport system substrate-specific component